MAPLTPEMLATVIGGAAGRPFAMPMTESLGPSNLTPSAGKRAPVAPEVQLRALPSGQQQGT